MNLCFWGIDLASVSAICLLDFAISLFNFFFKFIPAFDFKREITTVIYGNHSKYFVICSVHICSRYQMCEFLSKE